MHIPVEKFETFFVRKSEKSIIIWPNKSFEKSASTDDGYLELKRTFSLL